MLFAVARFLSFNRHALVASLFVAATAAILPHAAQAEASLVIEADTGKVLHADNATHPWYPASVTKIMTAYVTLKAVKDGRITLDTLFTVSPNAVAQQPSKMGFKTGTRITVDNALKMMMVKSANDVAVVLAEGVAGSIDNFSNEMNKTAQQLGMTQTSYVNPNGLPADGQITSARDLAILARAVMQDLPEYEYFMRVPAIKFGRRVTQNFNKLIGRYPGADGMKTGFICASGFNLVATATHGKKRLIAVVLGAQSSTQRAVKAAHLLERGFNGNPLTWLKPSLGTVDALTPVDAQPPNLRDDVCGPKRKRPPSEDEDDDIAIDTANPDNGSAAMVTAQLHGTKASTLLAAAAAPAVPVIVHTGPARTGAALLAADAEETARQTLARKGKKGEKRSKIAAKPDATAVKSQAAATEKPSPDSAATKLATAPTQTGPKTQAKTDTKSAKGNTKADGKGGAKPAAE